MDGSLTKVPLGGEATDRNPTDRGKSGVKRSFLTDANGVPLGLAVAGANRHDQALVTDTLHSILVPRPESSSEHPQHLCLDNGYKGEPIKELVEEQKYLPHVTPKYEESEKKTCSGV